MDAPDALTPSPELVDVFLENTHALGWEAARHRLALPAFGLSPGTKTEVEVQR